MPSRASTVSASARLRLTRPIATPTATPAPPIQASSAPLSIRAPQPISAAATIGSPSALFSGTKKSLPTNHSPMTTRLKIAKPATAMAG